MEWSNECEGSVKNGKGKNEVNKIYVEKLGGLKSKLYRYLLECYEKFSNKYKGEFKLKLCSNMKYKYWNIYNNRRRIVVMFE